MIHETVIDLSPEHDRGPRFLIFFKTDMQGVKNLFGKQTPHECAHQQESDALFGDILIPPKNPYKKIPEALFPDEEQAFQEP